MAKADEWADLAEATFETSYKREGGGGRRVDILAEVPASVRDKLEALYALFDKEYKTPKGKTIKAGDPKYVDWNAGTEDRAKEFKKMAQRYGDYRPDGAATVRATIFSPVKGEPATWVHFTMKPREVRNA